jgi:catechol 2,3-dioxygenase-like lactoylglutathione lyase family enzyme
MITGLSIVTVWVLDRDSAKKFYTEQLGFTLTNDIELESGMRWLTVRPPGSENQEMLLLDPMHSMLDEESAQQVRALIAKGALSPGVMATSDCKGDHAMLAGRGVEFIQEPAERPYGIEALLRDDSGNWFSFCQHKFLEGKA